MKSLTETFTPLIKNLQDLNQEIRVRLSSTAYFMGPEMRSLLSWSEEVSKMAQDLENHSLFVRSEHSALNTLLQGAGAIVMKKALVILDDYIKDLDAHFVANVHDEWQIEVREDQSEEVGKYGVKAIREAGEYFNLNCPLDGEYNVGKNWSETH